MDESLRASALAGAGGPPSPAEPRAPPALLEATRDFFAAFLASLPPARLEELRSRVYEACARRDLRALLLPRAPAAGRGARAGRRGAAAEAGPGGAERGAWGALADPGSPSLLQVCGRLGMNLGALPLFQGALEARGLWGPAAAAAFPAPPYLFAGQVFCDLARVLRSPAAAGAPEARRALRATAGGLLAAYAAPLAAEREARAGGAPDREALRAAALSDALLDEALGPLAERFWPRGPAGYPLPAPLPEQLSLLADCVLRGSPAALRAALGALEGPAREARPARPGRPGGLAELPALLRGRGPAPEALDLDLSALPPPAFWAFYRALLRAVRPEVYQELSAALRRS